MDVRTDVRECSIARTLDLVGEKWSLLVIRELMLANHRFEEMVRRTGAPRDILTSRLRKLEEHGLLERVEYQTRPTRYEYRLTALGWSLMPVLTMLRAWGDEHLSGADGAPVEFEHSCGARLLPVVACAACGDHLRSRDVHVLPEH